MHVRENLEIVAYKLGVARHSHIQLEIFGGFSAAVFDAETEQMRCLGFERRRVALHTI